MMTSMISEFINDIRRRLKKIITDDNMLDGSFTSDVMLINSEYISYSYYLQM